MAPGATGYQWQTNSGSGWTNLADGGVYTGTGTDALTVTTATAGLNATQYRCAITNACNPSAAAVLLINASPTSDVSITASEDNICAGTSASFTAYPTNGGSQPTYQWQLNGKSVGANSATYTNGNLNDQDVISCILTGSLTCATPVASQNQVTMTVNANPTISTIPDTIIAPGRSVTLQTNATGPVTSYQWTPAVGLDNPNSATPVAAPGNTTTYQVVATTNANCTTTTKVTVGIFRTLILPNAFTPNGDGRNDLFRIPPSSSVKITNFAVYDRWGSRVFYTGNSTAGWDGTCGGKQEPTGTYVWIIDYTDAVTGTPAEVKGTVILIR
jgi:gliding motility-associated-like protein